VIDSILPVGRDCDCGHPLVWRDSAQVCAVYGRHPSVDEVAQFADDQADDRVRVLRRRETAAVGATLVQLCAAAPNLTRNAERLRRVRAAARDARAVS
jgi:predicted nucleotidyltransferase